MSHAQEYISIAALLMNVVGAILLVLAPYKLDDKLGHFDSAPAKKEISSTRTKNRIGVVLIIISTGMQILALTL